MTSDAKNRKGLRAKARRLRYKTALIFSLLALSSLKEGQSQDVFPQNDKKDFKSEKSVKEADHTPTLNMRYLLIGSEEANEIMDQLADSSFISYVKRYEEVSRRLIEQIMKKNGKSYKDRVIDALSMNQDSTWLARSDVPAGLHCVFGCYSACVKSQGDSIMRNVLSHCRSNIVNRKEGIIQELAGPYGGMFRFNSKKAFKKNTYEYDVVIGNTGDPHCVSLIREKDSITLRAFNGEHLNGFWNCTQAVSLHKCYIKEYSKIRDDYQNTLPIPRLISFIENYMTNEKGKLLVNNVIIDGKEVSVNQFLEDLKLCNEFIENVALKIPEPDTNLLAGAVAKIYNCDTAKDISGYDSMYNKDNKRVVMRQQTPDPTNDKEHKHDERPHRDVIPTQFRLGPRGRGYSERS